MSISMRERVRSNVATFLVPLLLGVGSAAASVDIDQQPLLVAKPVPGNMAIVGSLEFPTMVSKANNTCTSRCNVDTGYSSSSTSYVGYFDNNKCYNYVWNSDEEKRHFSPDSSTNDGICAGSSLWSGKFLNWATTQAIDNFRSVLTGGYRVEDTDTETWLEKAWQDGQGGTANFPRSSISNSDLIGGATPLTTWEDFQADIIKRGNKLLFRRSGTNFSNSEAFNPADISTINVDDNSSVYEISVRVKVCVSGMLEDNCEQYPDGNYKPTGLIQQNSGNMRFSGFGYLGDGSESGSDSDINRAHNGGVMRARMKFVGPDAVDPDNGLITNTHAEWDPDTGVFAEDPDPDDSSGTTSRTGQTVDYSGVINFINRSGQNFPEAKYKRRDNVSELYYAATRYFRGLPNLSEYTDIDAAIKSSLSTAQKVVKKKQLVDGLPVITDWDDPIQYECQNNFILGIGDTNTAYDRNLPGGTAPTPVDSAENPINAATLTSKVFSLEGVSQGGHFNGSGRSAYIAGLAYHANASDIRPDMDDRQSVSTYWIDILEFGALKNRANNQYWLAAKYGGFNVPDDFNYETHDTSLPLTWWKTNTDPLLSTNDPRPDNFYTVAQAEEMRQSLIRAFADIQKEQTGNRSSLALNSTTLEAGSATFQAEYTSGAWTGDLNAFTLDQNTGALSLSPAWTASSKLPQPTARNIKTWNGTTFVKFDTTIDGINNTTLTGLLRTDSGTTKSATDVINYLRGERTNENNATGFRVRQGILGDIVNSQPVFIGNPKPGLFRDQTFDGSDTYDAWAESLSRTSTVYVGSNDGMLHGFNATTGATNSGVETFAYVPKTVIENGLGELANPAYNHRYFVDGELTVADAYDGTNWRTILVGTLGAGSVAKDRSATSNAIFALDVTDPGNVTFLWEKSSADIPELGNNLGKPVIAQITDGNWSVLLGNGPNSTGGKAQLVSINLFTGTNAVKSTAMSADIGNGLSAVRTWDSDGNGLTDTVYAGDLQGNLWKVTELANTAPTVQKLFQARDASDNPQPITSSPLAGRSPFSQEVWLFFGTGQYLNTADLSDTSVQTWYGIIVDDESTTTVSRSDLLERKILLDVPVTEDVSARVIEAGAREDLLGKRGWYIELLPNGTGPAVGERMVTPNQFQGSALIGNTRIPDASDPCAPTGRGVIMSIDPFTGARLVQTFFDLNGDGVFNSDDMVKIDGVDTVVSGIGLNTGFSNPSFLGQKMYIPTDDGEISTLDIQPFTTGASRTSWRELINMGN
jgi:type IV pilus assembly protein PilY1